MEATAASGAPRNFATWHLCVGAGWVFLVGFILAWGVLGYNIPTLSPAMTQSDLYAHYAAHNGRIRIAMGLAVVFMPFYFVLSAVISRVMQQVEGPGGPLALVEQMGGAVTAVVGQVACMAWLLPAFRFSERSPELVRAFYDFAWLYLDMTYMVTGLQFAAVALVFLSDRRAVPLIPKWVCWLSVLVASIFFLLTTVPFFLAGPFAWDGLINYWISLGGFFVWTVTMLIHLPRAIRRLEGEAAPRRTVLPGAMAPPLGSVS